MRLGGQTVRSMSYGTNQTAAALSGPVRYVQEEGHIRDETTAAIECAIPLRGSAMCSPTPARPIIGVWPQILVLSTSSSTLLRYEVNFAACV